MIALVLQFHESDKPQAMRLARMIADIEHLPREDVKFIFAARFDCEHDEETVNHVRVKFPYVEAITTTTKLIGWPFGPNAMAVDVLEYLDAGSMMDGALLLEPDCVPLSRHWLNVLIDEWQTARKENKVILGAWRNSGPPGGHINGNCILHPQLASWLRSRGFEVRQMAGGMAWDCSIAPWVRDHWMTTGRILNHFQSVHATEDSVLTPDMGDDSPVLVHGYKDDSAYALARKLLSLDEIAKPATKAL